MLFKSIVLSAALLLCTGPAHAASRFNEAKYSFEGVDITPLVEYLREEIVTLQTPVTVYNWSRNAKSFEQGDRTYGARGTSQFWSSFASAEGQNEMYGLGLYAAMDPVITASYGGSKVEWLLTEIKLPAGFVLVDVTIGVDMKRKGPRKCFKDFEKFGLWECLASGPFSCNWRLWAKYKMSVISERDLS
jgi:hypothetical protein